jgi:hypothetical protein
MVCSKCWWDHWKQCHNNGSSSIQKTLYAGNKKKVTDAEDTVHSSKEERKKKKQLEVEIAEKK